MTARALAIVLAALLGAGCVDDTPHLAIDPPAGWVVDPEMTMPRESSLGIAMVASQAFRDPHGDAMLTISEWHAVDVGRASGFATALIDGYNKSGYARFVSRTTRTIGGDAVDDLVFTTVRMPQRMHVVVRNRSRLGAALEMVMGMCFSRDVDAACDAALATATLSEPSWSERQAVRERLLVGVFAIVGGGVLVGIYLRRRSRAIIA